MDRREAIHTALSMATPAMRCSSPAKARPIHHAGARKETPWSDAQVVREELEKLLS